VFQSDFNKKSAASAFGFVHTKVMPSMLQHNGCAYNDHYQIKKL
jgi:hypothetical protein